MRVLLIDGDGPEFPNLALMKWSGYHKEQGNEIYFGSCSNPSEIYISCVFTWNREKATSASTYYPNAKIHFGGSGFNLSSELPYEVEHHKPDYSLYPNVDFSLGFTSRGCIRNCPWCVVPKKEGWIREHSPLNEFIEPSFNKIMLLDNNFLASPKSIEKLEQIITLEKKISFNQGLDIRLINEKNAKLLSQTRYYDLKFKSRRLYFAWDIPQIESQVIKGIETLLATGIRKDHLMFYVLTGYNTNYREDLHRVEKLISLGVKPYVMIYNNLKGPHQRHLKRWIEMRYYEILPWIEYDHGDSQKVINEMEAKFCLGG